MDDISSTVALEDIQFFCEEIDKLGTPHILGQLALSTLSGLAHSRKKRRSNRFLIIEKL
jgi:hypothetical protein